MLINVTAPRIVAFVAFLQSTIEERLRSITPLCTAYVVYDSPQLQIDPILETLQHDAAYTVLVSPFNNVPHKFITREEHDESHVYIFVFSNVRQFHRIDEIAGRLTTPAPKIVLLLDTDSSVADLTRRAAVELRRLERYVLIRSDGEVLLNLQHLRHLRVNLTDRSDVDALQVQIQRRVQAERNRNDITIFVHYRLFYCMMVPIGVERDGHAVEYELLGSDVMVASSVARQLRRTDVKISTDGMLLDPMLKTFKRIENNYDEHKIDMYDFNARLFTFKPAHVFDFNTTTETADMYFNADLILPDPNANENFINLYPHTTDCWVLLVPYVKQRVSFLVIFSRQPIVWIFICSVVLLALTRAVLRVETVPGAILQTYGAAFGQLRMPHPQSRPAAYVWTSMMLLTAIITSTLLSGSIYAILVNVKYEPEIDTFAQLLATDLLIYSNDRNNDDFYEFADPLMRERTRYVNADAFRVALFVHQNTSNAYVIFESDAAAFLHLVNRDELKFRLMRETMECYFIAYQIPRASPIRADVDRAVQLLSEYGLQGVYTRWSIQFALGEYNLDRSAAGEAHRSGIAWAEIGAVFWAYGIGMLAAAFAFGLEHFVWVGEERD